MPAAIRAEISGFGLPRDEFEDTGGWPHELYIREARRMVSGYVMTEKDCRGLSDVPVCLSASHIAYGSIRMEPVFMVLAQAAATAASLAIDGGWVRTGDQHVSPRRTATCPRARPGRACGPSRWSRA